MRSPFLPQPARFPDLPPAAPQSRPQRRWLVVAVLLLTAAAAVWLSARAEAAASANASLQQIAVPVG